MQHFKAVPANWNSSGSGLLTWMTLKSHHSLVNMNLQLIHSCFSAVVSAYHSKAMLYLSSKMLFYILSSGMAFLLGGNLRKYFLSLFYKLPHSWCCGGKTCWNNIKAEHVSASFPLPPSLWVFKAEKKGTLGVKKFCRACCYLLL